MEDVLVSVAVPVYRVEKQLFLDCVGSLTGQTEERLEILLIFDGTMPLYEDILSEPVFQDARVQAVGCGHAGVSAARNEGIRRARGKWLMFVDADDCLTGDAVERLVREAERRPQTDLAVGDYRICYPRGTKDHAYKKQAAWFEGEQKMDFLRDVLNPQTGMGFCWAKLYRRSCLEKNEIRFREELEVAEDAEFVLKFAMRARGVCYEPCPAYLYRINENSAVRKFRADYAKRYETAMLCIRGVIQSAGYEEQLQTAYETCVLYHLLLVTVNFSFHPKQKKGVRRQILEYNELTKSPLYAEALRMGDARRFSLSRRLSVLLIRLHCWPGVYLAAWLRHRQLKF